LRGSDGVDLCQLAVHLVQPIGGERGQSAQGLGYSGLSLPPLIAVWGSHFRPLRENPNVNSFAVEVVGDELKVLKANGVVEGESTACQMFTVGDCK
jgi:hypothetical protein